MPLSRLCVPHKLCKIFYLRIKYFFLRIKTFEFLLLFFLYVMLIMHLLRYKWVSKWNASFWLFIETNMSASVKRVWHSFLSLVVSMHNNMDQPEIRLLFFFSPSKTWYLYWWYIIPEELFLNLNFVLQNKVFIQVFFFLPQWR